ncbi:DUF1801 domain-containing protein [Alginatibacterium sediminis]|uniref:DUF1801 domain-containing protein n=1 Tax=Alginatibacterium sediminis TaxID=2164068 RepID=A0A420ED65_9ALTE|nr:DUF1801 domain-containing protein [Alginatibacterium sediminis]RKF18647.1 DUF1801 domain-containing protein [Alginatibacterium sediminis]
MAQLKTRPNGGNVQAFIANVAHEQRRADAEVLLTLFLKVSQRPAVMWGDSIIGFGRYEYSNQRGKHSWLLTGFSPRKQNTTIYIMQGFELFSSEIARLGKVKTARSCLYINRLENIDMQVLEQLLKKAVIDMRHRYTCY